MKAERGSKISVDYKLYIDDPSGELVEETDTKNPYSFILGSGEQFEAFDKHIIGLQKGDSFSFAVQKEEAFGEINEEAVVDIPKKVFAHEGKIDESIFDPNIPDDYILIDPANTAEKAELGLLCILPFNVAMIAYKHFKKRWNGIMPRNLKANIMN